MRARFIAVSLVWDPFDARFTTDHHPNRVAMSLNRRCGEVKPMGRRGCIPVIVSGTSATGAAERQDLNSRGWSAAQPPESRSYGPCRVAALPSPDCAPSSRRYAALVGFCSRPRVFTAIHPRLFESRRSAAVCRTTRAIPPVHYCAETGMHLAGVQRIKNRGQTSKPLATGCKRVVTLAYRRERQAAGIEVAKKRGIYQGHQRGTTKGKPARAKDLRAKGLNAGGIARALGVSERTVFQYLG